MEKYYGIEWKRDLIPIKGVINYADRVSERDEKDIDKINVREVILILYNAAFFSLGALGIATGLEKLLR